MNISSNYLDPVFMPSTLKSVVTQTAAKILELQKELGFEAIAFTGFSGSSVAFPVSFITELPLLAVRKDSDDAHHVTWYGSLEGFTGAESYIILDDFISGGNTVKRIIDRISEKNPKAKCVGIVLWNSSSSSLDWKSIPIFHPEHKGW